MAHLYNCHKPLTGDCGCDLLSASEVETINNSREYANLSGEIIVSIERAADEIEKALRNIHRCCDNPELVLVIKRLTIDFKALKLHFPEMGQWLSEKGDNDSESR